MYESFFSCCFQDFVFVYLRFDCAVLRSESLCVYPAWIHYLFGTGDKCFTWNLKSLSQYFFKSFFSFLCLFSLLWFIPIAHILAHGISDIFSLRLFSLLFIFFLCYLDWISHIGVSFKFCLLLCVKFTDSCVNIYLSCWVLVAAYRIFSLFCSTWDH